MLYGKLNVLPRAVVLPDDGRRIVGRIRKFFRLPDDFARRLVERRDGAFGPAWSADDLVAVHQDRLGVAPVRRFATQVRQRNAPIDLAVGDSSANQLPLTAEAVDTFAIHSRRSPRPAAPVEFYDWTDGGSPKFLPRVGIQCDQDFGSVARAHGEKLAVHDGRTGVAVAGVLEEPKPLRSTGRPFLQQTAFPGNVGAVRAAPLRPVEAAAG